MFSENDRVGALKHWVFISYAHEDFDFARRLKTRFEGFKLNNRIRSASSTPPLPETGGRIFLDKDDMVKDGQDLPDVIRREIAAAQKLIVLCSPSAAKPTSHVNLEVQEFIRLGRWKDIHPVIIGGRPSDIHGPNDCFPTPIRMRFDEQGVSSGINNPLCPDFRKGPNFRDAQEWANLLSAILGVDRSHLYNVMQRRKVIRYLSAATGCVAVAVGAVAAFNYLETVGRQQRIASHAAAFNYAASIAEQDPIEATKVVLAAWPQTAAEAPSNIASGTDILKRFNTLGKLRTVYGDADVTTISFSPDGRRVLTASTEGLARVWERETGKELIVIGEDRTITTAVFSPDGSNILTGSNKGLISLRNGEAGKIIRHFSGHEGGIVGAIFSLDGLRILSASEDGTARLWETATGREVKRYEGHESGLYSAVFNPDGSEIMTTSSDNTVRLWDMETAAETHRLDLSEGEYVNAEYSPDGSKILTTLDKPFAVLWDAATGTEIRRFSHAATVNRASFSPDGSEILTASDDSTARLWHAAEDKPIRIFDKHGDDVYYALFSPDGEKVMTASTDNFMGLWERRTAMAVEVFDIKGIKVWSDAPGAFSRDGSSYIFGSSAGGRRFEISRDKILAGHSRRIAQTKFSPDGKLALSASSDRTARVWDIASGKEIRRFSGHTGRLSKAIFSPDQSHVLTVSLDKTARLWDMSSGQEVRKFADFVYDVEEGVFSPDGTQILLTGFYNEAFLYDTRTGSKIRDFVGHHGWIRNASFSKDGSKLLTASQDNTARLWNVATGEPIKTFEGHTGFVDHIAFLPNETQVLTDSGSDETSRLWDIISGKEIRRFPGRNAAFSSNGSMILTSAKGESVLWNAATGNEIRRFKGDGILTGNAIFSPDDFSVLVTSGSEATLWETATGVSVAKFPGLIVSPPSFSPDGSLVMAPTDENQVRIWDLSRYALRRNALEFACQNLPYKGGSTWFGLSSDIGKLADFENILAPISDCSRYSSAPNIGK